MTKKTEKDSIAENIRSFFRKKEIMESNKKESQESKRLKELQNNAYRNQHISNKSNVLSHTNHYNGYESGPSSTYESSTNNCSSSNDLPSNNDSSSDSGGGSCD